MSTPGSSSDYDRGRVDAILAEHSAHFSRINGSIDRFADRTELLAAEVGKLALQMQRLANRSETRWTAVGRLTAVTGALTALATLAAYLVYLARP